MSRHTLFLVYAHIERDRALYDASLQSAVNYTVASPDDAPMSLTFGDRFMELAGSYDGQVTIGIE